MERIDRKGLNEFRTLVVESRRKITQQTVGDEAAKKIITADDSELAEITNDQLELVDLFVKSPSNYASKTLPIGRPKKVKEDKVLKKTIYLTPNELDFLIQLPFGRGVGSKIKKIISEYKRYVIIEKEQTLALIKLSQKVQLLLNEFNMVRDLRSEKSREISAEIMRARRDICTYLNLLSLSLKDIEKFLTKEEYRALDFAISFSSRSLGH